MPDPTETTNPTQTWHHGLVARWWAEFNEDGEDIEFFEAAIARSGEPALDAGCGTGRILIPLLHRGVDIDGSDAAADMLRWCTNKLNEQQLTTRLYPQAMHELNTKRTYQTIIICGAFGLGGSRADDLLGLEKIHACLKPGAMLVMDHYLPGFSKRSWESWIRKPTLPQPWPDQSDRRTCSDGTQLELNSRVFEFDPLNQTTVREIRVRHYGPAEDASQTAPHIDTEQDVLLAEETYPIRINIYFKAEIELLLQAAGFVNIQVSGGLEDRPAVAWQDERIVFTAFREQTS